MKYYFKTHEWIEELSDNIYRMGVSKYAADQLGDIVFLEAKTNGTEFKKGNSLAILESVKAVGDIYAPFDCKVKETNQDLINSPELINENPEITWIVEIEAKSKINISNLDESMDKEDYQGKYLASI